MPNPRLPRGVFARLCAVAVIGAIALFPRLARAADDPSCATLPMVAQIAEAFGAPGLAPLTPTRPPRYAASSPPTRSTPRLATARRWRRGGRLGDRLFPGQRQRPRLFAGGIDKAAVMRFWARRCEGPANEQSGEWRKGKGRVTSPFATRYSPPLSWPRFASAGMPEAKGGVRPVAAAAEASSPSTRPRATC